MRPLALALILPFGAAHADTCQYGGPHGTRASIQPHDEAFAEIVITNRLAPRHRTTCDLVLFGVTISLQYDAGAGSLPDWFIPTLPQGFRAEPEKLLLDDSTEGSILIWLEDGVGS
jgi:hypothetical protein